VTERQSLAVAKVDRAQERPQADNKPPKVLSPVDPSSGWMAKAKRVQFGYGLSHLLDLKNAVVLGAAAILGSNYI
jgi:hypothetical protein